MSSEIAEAPGQGVASADGATVEAPALAPGAGDRPQPPPHPNPGAWHGERDTVLPPFVRALQSALPTLLVAGVLCLITFLAGGGLNLSTRTPVEIALTLACGVGIAAAILLAPPGRSRETRASGAKSPFRPASPFRPTRLWSVVGRACCSRSPRYRRCRRSGRFSPTPAGRTPGACSPTAPCSRSPCCSRALPPRSGRRCSGGCCWPQ